MRSPEGPQEGGSTAGREPDSNLADQGPTGLARTLKEVGRLVRTLHLFRAIDDAAYRRRILVPLNRGGGGQQLARIVLHHEGQEDQLEVLRLVVNVILPWNTICMDATLSQLRARSFDVRLGNVARLSPLGFDRVNMLGRHALTPSDGIARAGLRSLRDP